MEPRDAVRFKGVSVTLVGNEVRVGDSAPDFTALDGEFKPVSLSSFRGRNLIISSVPSLDTPVCELQTRRFNDEAARRNLLILTLSMDLPFAQKRFCETFGTANIVLLSDFRDRQFANAFGLYIKELGLLARAVFVIDRNGKIVYREIVNDIGTPPDFDKALQVAGTLG